MHRELPKLLACKDQNIIIIAFSQQTMHPCIQSQGGCMQSLQTKPNIIIILDSKEFLQTHFDFSLQQLRELLDLSQSLFSTGQNSLKVQNPSERIQNGRYWLSLFLVQMRLICFFVVISYACANVTTIILNGSCKNLSACQLTFKSPQKIQRVTSQREYVPPFPSAHKCVYVFTSSFICFFFL